MENDVMITELLNAWEETYKKGQLTFEGTEKVLIF